MSAYTRSLVSSSDRHSAPVVTRTGSAAELERLKRELAKAQAERRKADSLRGGGGAPPPAAPAAAPANVGVAGRHVISRALAVGTDANGQQAEM